MNTNTWTDFERAPVPRAVLKNAVPAMAAMLMVLICNLADTFFIAQTRSDILVAADCREEKIGLSLVSFK